MIKAIIFDCFGVLYPNASGNYFKRHRDLFDNDSAYLDKLNLQIDLGQITRAEFFARLEEEIGIPADQIQTEIDQELIANSQLVELIKKLQKTYKIGLLSNAGQEEIAIIHRDNIDNLFNAVTISYETGRVKPSREIYLICAERLGVKPNECLFVDDNIVNIEAARNLNMDTILYKDFEDFSRELNGFKLSISGSQN